MFPSVGTTPARLHAESKAHPLEPHQRSLGHDRQHESGFARASLSSLLQRPTRLQTVAVPTAAPPVRPDRRPPTSNEVLTDSVYTEPYSLALAEAMEAVVSASPHTSRGRHRSSRQFASHRASAGRDAAIAELTLTPVSERRELLQLFLECAGEVPVEIWKDILLFRLQNLQEKQQPAPHKSTSTQGRVSLTLDRLPRRSYEGPI